MKRIELFVKGIIRYIKNFCFVNKTEITIVLLLLYIIEYMHLVSFGLHKEMLMEHITSIFIDCMFLVIIAGCVTWFRKRYAYIVAGTIAFLWILPNVVYYRFFSQYLSFSCIQEIGNFNGTWWFGYLDKAFKPLDITIVIAFLAILVLSVTRIERRKRLNIKWILVAEGIALCFSCFVIPFQRAVKWNMNYEVETLEKAIDLYECNSTPLIYKYGIFRSQIYFNVTHFHTGIDLTQNDMLEISECIESRRSQVHDGFGVAKNKNVVFILVESFLSVALDKTVDGQKVMPCLSSLLSEEGTYYNPNIHQNICAGESADGQLIYMTGLLPIRNVITVTECLHSDVIGFPMMLRDSLGYTTCMTLPTNPSFYHQTEINKKYGIDRIESVLNNGMFTNDETLFMSAARIDKTLKQPFFHILLSLSMHGPYDKESYNDNEWNVKFPNMYSAQFKNYLRVCHYTDKQIGKYIEHLKKDGLWENTLVVIVADHEAHDWLLNTDKKNLNDGKLPLIIANTGISPDVFSSNDANQIDVFPTLLDLVGINPKWRGLGHSLMNQDYNHQTNLENEYEISEKIIRGNYFRKANMKK